MDTNETGQGPKLPPDARLDSLDERIERMQQEEAKRTGIKPPDPNYRIGQLVLGHLIGAPIGGAVVGWGLDSLAALAGHRTFPLFFLVMLFLGFGVGIRNVLRISKTSSGPRAGQDS